jgi:hypothetical protein
MASTKQVVAAKRNVKKAQAAAKRRRTIANLPRSVRQDLGRQASRSRQRGGKPGRKLEDRTREQLYELAKRRHVPGRSKMGQVGADRRLADGSLTRGVVGQRGLHLGCQPIGGEVLSQRETLGRVAQRESACFTRKRS